RIGLAWDVRGDGSLAIRTSYGISYDFPSADYHNINASAPPFGNRSLLQDPPGLFDDPYRTYGGDPPPFVTNADTRFVNYGSYTNCTVPANLDQRRILHDPLIGVLDLHTDVGVQSYRGMKLSIRRREANGLSMNANYTLSRCVGNTATGTFPQLSTGYTKPNDPSFDYGHCSQDRTHIGVFTLGYVTPQFAGRTARIIASDWRLSGIFNGASGAWLLITTGQDNSGNGLNNQRPNRISNDVY